VSAAALRQPTVTMVQVLVDLPGGCTRVIASSEPGLTVAWLSQRLEDLEGIPVSAQRLVCGSRALRPAMPLVSEVAFVSLRLRLPGGGGDGDQPDWMERGKVMTGPKPRRGPTARAPDWHGNAQKYSEKMEKDKRDRGELVVAIGPFCVPCGKRFAKQTTFDAHLSGSKHLKALQKLGRVEEAMVCQIDVDAKRRKIAEVEEARFATGPVEVVESEEEIALRRAAREEKLRERAMMSYPEEITASSVYADDLPTEVDNQALATELSLAEQAAAASGDIAGTISYTSGMQDGSLRPNKHTSGEMAAAHRAQAIVPNDWMFGSAGAATAAAAQEEVPLGPSMPDVQLTCKDCQKGFLFKGAEQEHFEKMGYDPTSKKRCKECAFTRRQTGNGMRVT